MASLVDPKFWNKYIPNEKTSALENQAVLEVEYLLADQGSCWTNPAVPLPADSNNATDS